MVTMRLPEATEEAIESGLERIREQFDVPGEFPPEVLAAAEEAARRPPDGTYADRTAERFVTLDPATSTDLDQAFTIDRDSEDLLLHYAIADVGFFVTPGDPIDLEAWRRGVTVFLPGRRARLYPPVLSEAAASLLPEGPRPSVVFTVRIRPDGDARLDGVERALIHSRAKLGYETVATEELPAGFAELARRIERAEERRDASRVEFPEQQLSRTDDGWVLRFRPRTESEDRNAALSLATNLAVADALHAVGTGLFRVMPAPDERAIRRLRHSATAFGLTWPPAQSLADFERTLRREDPRHAAFLLAVRKASGAASYAAHHDGEKPWHAAVAATYVHATAPMRRLADRYVIEAALAVANGRPVPDDVQAAFAELPAVMERTETRADRVDSAVIALAEAVMLVGREGEVFDAVLVDEDAHGAVIQVVDPAVLARVEAHRVDPGDAVRVRLSAVDVPSRHIEFTRVG
jgi:exoribonuclease R